MSISLPSICLYLLLFALVFASLFAQAQPHAPGQNADDERQALQRVKQLDIEGLARELEK